MFRFIVSSPFMPSRAEHKLLTVAGRDVAISNPQKGLLPQGGFTKLDLARYYFAW